MGLSHKDKIGKKIARGVLGGLGISLATFIVVVFCCALTFPFIVTAGVGSDVESQFTLNLVVPPIVIGLVVAFLASIVGFIFFFRGDDDWDLDE